MISSLPESLQEWGDLWWIEIAANVDTMFRVDSYEPPKNAHELRPEQRSRKLLVAVGVYAAVGMVIGGAATFFMVRGDPFSAPWQSTRPNFNWELRRWVARQIVAAEVCVWR